MTGKRCFKPRTMDSGCTWGWHQMLPKITACFFI